MRRTKVSESIGYINDKYVNEATLYTGKERAGRHNRLLKWGAAACCLTAILIVGVSVMTSREGNHDGQVMVGGLLRPYRDISARADEIAIEWQWEYMTLYEQYATIDLNGKEYISRMREVGASFLGDGLGSGDAEGYDLCTEQTYHRTFEINRIRGISDDLMVAVNMDGKYYVFMNMEYDPPATFGELLDGYDLANTLDFNWFTVCEGYTEKGYYSLENDDAIWQVLTACQDARFVEDDAWNRGAENYISFTATSEPLGVYQRVFYVSEDGYIRTNIFDWGYIYQIGEEAAGQIIAYATENADEAEPEPYSYWLAGTLTEVCDGYILVDDSILCDDPGEGMVFKVLTDDLRISRYVDSKIVGIGDVVMVQFTGDIDIAAGNLVIGAYSMSPASISDGNVMVNE